MIELAQHIETLLLENDCVIVPGFGGFVAHYSPATRVKEENIFLPPTRTIGFNPQLKLNDGVLVQSYMSAYDTSFADASRIVEKEVNEFIGLLHEEGKAHLDNIGEIHYNIYGNYEFVPYDYKITTPSLYGLDSFEIHELSALQQKEKVLVPTYQEKEKKTFEISINRAYLRNAAAMPHMGQPGRDFIDLKTMKIVVSINWNSIVDLPPQLSSSNCIEDVAGKEYEGVNYTRQELLNNFFCEIAKCFFSDEGYYKVGGNRPMVYIKNKTAEIYAKDSKAMYDSIRRAVKEATGYDIYIVAESADVWCNQMRYQYFYMSGGVDAVASRNMYDQSEVTRSYMYPQMIDQNWKYNRETALPAFGDGSMELIPTVGPGWNKLIQDGRGAIGNSPIVKRDPATYRTICNVAKMNAGRNRLIFIDSYNKYNFDSFIEPTVEGYGNGYGKTYLQITREQFKKN